MGIMRHEMRQGDEALNVEVLAFVEPRHHDAVRELEVKEVRVFSVGSQLEVRKLVQGHDIEVFNGLGLDFAAWVLLPELQGHAFLDKHVGRGNVELRVTHCQAFHGDFELSDSMSFVQSTIFQIEMHTRNVTAVQHAGIFDRGRVMGAERSECVVI